ncbi:hypothetical protein BDR26DRAFT_1000006 [Obelidium mucronatum]|nr:hypothetical protein BDR26DRAFT_1000006 [Obelidium mucronatum]
MYATESTLYHMWHLVQLDDRTKGQEFVYSLNTDGVEELVAGRIKLPPYILKVAMPHIRDLAAIFRRSQPKVKTRGNMRVINLCSWTGGADGIKDPHYPADVANGLAVFGKENIKPELLPHFEGLQPLVAYLTGVVESLVHREAFEMVANISLLLPSPKKHPASGAAMKAFRDAIFMINDENQMNVEAVLKGQFNGMTFEEMFVKDPDWLLKRGFQFFLKQLKQQMEKHVSAGCLSDPPGISLYRIIGKDKYGLTIYLCLRGSSALESFHQTGNQTLQPCERYRPRFPKTGHYNHFLFDYINDVAQRLYGEPILSWWSIPAVRTITSESFGVAPCVPVD